MSTYLLAMRFSPAVRGLRRRPVGEFLMNWWVGLYAEPPRRLRPMI